MPAIRGLFLQGAMRPGAVIQIKNADRARRDRIPVAFRNPRIAWFSATYRIPQVTKLGGFPHP
jgi:hypothetical protein